jgi:ubiquinone/menaquinone biosynthesis C-methylase UbiE
MDERHVAGGADSEATGSRAEAGTGFPETADIETSSDDYATRFSGAIGEWLLQIQEDATARMLADFAGARVLDVGGGHGQLTPYLVRSGFEVTVTGSSEICRKRIEPFLENGRDAGEQSGREDTRKGAGESGRRGEDKGGRCGFEVADHLAMPFDDRSFDVVLCFRLLTHVRRWRELVAELARVADRAVIVDFSSVRSFNYIAPQLFKFKKRVEKNTRPFICYREADIVSAFAESGFVRADRYPQFFLPMALHRMVGSPGFSRLKEGGLRLFGLTSLFGSPVVLKLVRR